MEEKIVLIDGNSILNRAFYGVPDLTNSEGLHTNAVFGFLNILFKILDEETPEYLAVAFDVKHPTFRHELYADYKGTRKPMPAELAEQMPVIKEVLGAMGVTILEKPGYEADDILGTLAASCEKTGVSVALVSGDRDLLQMASDRVRVRIPKTKQGRTETENYNTQDVIDKYGITPKQIIDLKGLMGDASDNIPGVPGIGEKTAIKILSAFESVENAYEHVEEITPNRAREALRNYYDLAVLSKMLATIKTDCELDFELERAKTGSLYSEEAFKIMKRLEFKSFLPKFHCESTENEKSEQDFLLIRTHKEAESFFDRLAGYAKAPEFIAGLKVAFRSKEELEFPATGDGQYMLAGLGEQERTVSETLLGVSVAAHHSGKTEVGYIEREAYGTEKELLDRLKGLLAAKPPIAVLDLKSQLSILPLTEDDRVSDLSIGAYLLNPLKDSYGYDDIARDYLKMSVPSYAEMFGKTPVGIAAAEPEFYKYCCYEAYVALEAAEPIHTALREAEMEELYWDVEMPLVYTLYDMEQRGIRVNRQALKEYGDNLIERITELEQEIHGMAGEEFNINSPKQLGVILFEKLMLPFGKKTKTGYSTSADILEKLKEEHPIVALILEYRQLTKLKSTYADGLAVYIEEDGRIHGTFNQTIAATGRLSSTEPNLQNIPIRMELGRRIRKVFIPEDGFVFLDGDYSQIELRILAHMSADERLISAYREAQDIHSITASQVFHMPLADVTPEQRSNAKAVNFGIVYGISSFGLGQGLNISRKEAETYIHKYFETYPDVKAFLDQLVEDAKTNGYAVSIFKRRRPVPELVSSNFMQRSFGERVAMNSPIQGTAADIMKIAMIRVNRRLKKEGFRSRLILQIHDELLIETHKDEIQAVRVIMEQEMFHAAELKVPLEVEVKQGDDWYSSK